jgi:cytochrome c-type biogenesis protein CcmH
LIRQRLAEGWTKEEIKAYFVQQYGDRVLAEPPPEGFNWLVYLVPPLAFLAGAAFVFRLLRSWKTAAPLPAVDTPTLDDEYVRRLEEELRKRG